MLLLLLFLHQAWSEDVPRNSNFTIKRTEDCPDVGYFFRRESNPNALPGCFLCFCQDNGTSFCWRRDDDKCDMKRYRLQNDGLKRKRPPRSPGFGDIFFKDAANSFFGKQAEGDCTPYESSFSDDCPPADWCTGCTVCDCTGEGKWECHLLSFCPDGKGKKTVKKRKPNRKAVIQRRNDVTTKVTTTITRRINPSTPATSKPRRIIKKSVPVALNQNKTTRRGKIPVRFKNQSRKNIPRQPMFIKKDVSTRKPVRIENNKPKLIGKPEHSVDPKQMARKVVKRVIAAVTKIMKNEIKNNKTKVFNKTQKLSIQKTVNNKNNNKPRPQFIEKHSKKIINAVTVMPKKGSNGKRMKRAISENVDNVTTSYPVTNITKTGDNITVLEKNTTESPATIPPIDENIAMFSKDSDYKVTEALSSYYKYVVDENIGNKTEAFHVNVSLSNTISNSSINYKIDNILKNKETNIHYIESPSIIVNDKKSQTKNRSNDLLSLSDILSANDLKNKRWSRIKLLKEKITKSDLRQGSKLKFYTTERKKINRKEVARKIGLPKKYNLKKLINTNKKVHINADTTKAASNKIYELQYFISNLLDNLSKDNTKTNVVKKKKYSALRFMKKFFGKIFGKGKTKINNKQNITVDKHQIIETLCENFGPCKIDARNRLLVKTKIDELHKETVDILRSIQIIKGLLKLVDMPKMEKDIKPVLNKKIRADLQKLNIILKGKYLDNNLPLGETQMFQIEYIRNNTNNFIKAISKFAATLNEIVTVLTNHVENRRILRNTNKEDPWKSIKDLLFKYNLVQNTFIKKMYEMITKSELIEENKCSKEVKTKSPISMETYSKNIVKKLRRLKNVATLLNSRRKRQAMRDDDALEYLLMLMEYLLKQSYPLDAAPPNDGIDLLIDAIRNAPDIKIIKKKVLENTPADIIPTRTVKPIITIDKNKSEINEISNEVTVPDDNKEISYTEADTKNEAEENATNIEVTTIKASKERGFVDIKHDLPKFLPLEDFEDNDDDKYDFNRKNIENSDLFGAREAITPLIDPLTKNPKQTHKDAREDDNKVRRFEIYPEFDENVAAANSITESSSLKTDITEKPTDIDKEETKPGKSGDSLENVEKRSRLDWIEENFDAEGTEFKIENITEPAFIATSTLKTSIITSIQPQVDISSITKELVDEEHKRSKIKAENVMHKKQMDLLNSLDYATDKTEFDDSSRDGGEMFAAYFV